MKIPKEVYHGFECATAETAMVINVSSAPYNRDDPDEHRLPFDSRNVPFKWNSTRGG